MQHEMVGVTRFHASLAWALKAYHSEEIYFIANEKNKISEVKTLVPLV